jgi:hypothetical protein
VAQQQLITLTYSEMKNLIRLIILAVFMSTGMLSAQEVQECGSTEYLERKLNANPSLRNALNGVVRQVETWIRNHPIDAHLHRIPVVIPVVVHNIWKENSEKLTVQQIRDQITLTNLHLARNAPGLSTVPAPFLSRATNVRVQLKLAVRDPNGSATNGINFHRTTQTSFSSNDDGMKKTSAGGVDAWDTNRYLNVWVCNLDDYCGYAPFPYNYGGTSPDEFHGVVVAKSCWGASSGKQGTTLTHELGHFLGLKHIWGDADCGDDDIADTPTQKNPSSGCPTGVVATGCSDSGANGRMYQNIMDYTRCRRMMTAGQARRVWGFLNYYARRSSLLDSDGLLPVGGRTRRYTTDFVSEYNNLPSWKAALAMVHGAAVGQCIPIAEINRLTQAGGSARGTRYQSLNADLANAIFGLGLDAEEVLVCYSAEGFYERVMNRGPVALLEISGSSIHGITITGMTISGTDIVFEISDPMNIGPRQFSLLGITQRGHRKIVTFASLSSFMESAVTNNRKIILARPMSRVAS